MKYMHPTTLRTKLQRELGIPHNRAAEGIRLALEKGIIKLGHGLRFHLRKLDGDKVTSWSRQIELSEPPTGILSITIHGKITSDLSQTLEPAIVVALTPSHVTQLRNLLNQYLDTNSY